MTESIAVEAIGRPVREDLNATTLENRIRDFLAQKRIAVVGVSRDDRGHPAAQLIYHRLKKTGHEVFAVNPHRESFDGRPCHPDLAAIPGGVDAVVLVTRPEVSLQIVRECERMGIHRVWMHGSMASGSSVSPQAAEYCRTHGITVIAGACPMMYGPGADLGHTCMRWILGWTGHLPA
jgi:predicted CoA-binding protein